MECVVLFRNAQNDKIGFVSDGDSGRIMVYRDRDAACREVSDIMILRAFPYQIVELDELAGHGRGGDG